MKNIIKKALLLLPCIVILAALHPKPKAIDAAIIIEDPTEYYRAVPSVEGIEITTSINNEDYSLFYDFTPLFAGYQNMPGTPINYYTFIANQVGVNNPNEYRITTKINAYAGGVYRGNTVYFLNMLLDMNFSGATNTSKYKLHLSDFFYKLNYKEDLTWYSTAPYVSNENVDTISIYDNNGLNPLSLAPFNVKYSYKYNYINEKNQSSYASYTAGPNEQNYLTNVNQAPMINYEFLQRGQLVEGKDTLYIMDATIEFTINHLNENINNKSIYLNIVMIDKNFTYSINNFMYDNGINSTDIGEIQSVFTTIAMGVSGILDVELFPGFSFSHILLMILTVTFVVLLLRFFAGG